MSALYATKCFHDRSTSYSSAFPLFVGMTTARVLSRDVGLTTFLQSFPHKEAMGQVKLLIFLLYSYCCFVVLK